MNFVVVISTLAAVTILWLLDFPLMIDLLDGIGRYSIAMCAPIWDGIQWTHKVLWGL
jgi:hypothetical protein